MFVCSSCCGVVLCCVSERERLLLAPRQWRDEPSGTDGTSRSASASAHTHTHTHTVPVCSSPLTRSHSTLGHTGGGETHRHVEMDDASAAPVMPQGTISCILERESRLSHSLVWRWMDEWYEAHGQKRRQQRQRNSRISVQWRCENTARLKGRDVAVTLTLCAPLSVCLSVCLAHPLTH